MEAEGIPPPQSIGADMTKRINEDKPPGYPLSFKIRPPESPGGLKLTPVFSMALIVSVIGAVLFMGLVGAVLWAPDGGSIASVSSNAVETEKQSALPWNELTAPAVRGASTHTAPQSPNAQPPGGATATKTSAVRKGSASAMREPSPTPIRAPTLTPVPAGRPAGPVAVATRVPTATVTRRPPTAYPTGGAPPPPGTCVLGCG